MKDDEFKKGTLKDKFDSKEDDNKTRNLKGTGHVQVWKNELERLKAQRDKLTPEHDYTIGGHIEMSVNMTLSRKLERTIRYYERQLDKIKDKAKDDFSRTR